MPSDLDRTMDAVMAAMTGAGGQLALGSVERYGRTLPTIAAAPPALSYYFAHYCAEHKDATFLVSGEERLTFGEVHAAAMRVAHSLVGTHGVTRGDRIGIAMKNSPAWVALYMGILIAGGIATLLNGWWQTDEMEAAIGDVGCTLILADPPRAKRIAEIGAPIPQVIEIDDFLPLDKALQPVATADDSDAALPQLGPDDRATILFTSGSTGKSKGALSTHRAVVQGIFNYLAQALMMFTILEQRGSAPQGQPSTLLTVPLFHVTAEVPVFLQSFAMGRKIVMMPKWDAAEAMRLIEKEKISYFVGVPLMSFEILNHPDRAKYDLSSVTDFAAGGAPRPVEHVRRIDEEMGGPAPLIGYGLTETSGVGTGNFRSNYLAKPESAGRASAPLVELAILDDEGRAQEQGVRGEISIRSVCNFEGYWDNPEATRAAVTEDGFFRTGDIGFLDEDGYLFIVDRKKDIIIRGGENISCPEVEAALYLHPGVAEAAVFGLPDDRLGEVPGAVVHAKAGQTIDEEALKEFLYRHIAAFKVPERIWIDAHPLPRLGTEKIDKVGLRKLYRSQGAVG